MEEGTLERYRIFKNVSEIESLIRQLLNQQLVLLGQLQELVAALSQTQQASRSFATRPAQRLYQAVREALRPASIVSTIPTPMELLDSSVLRVDTSEPKRYDIGDGQILMIVSVDDHIFVSDREFVETKGAQLVPVGTIFVLNRLPSWQRLWLKSMNTEADVYISEWRVVS